MVEHDDVLLSTEAIKSIRRIIDAAEEAISEIYSLATRGQFVGDLPPEVETFYRLHAEIVHGDDGDSLDKIF